MFITAYKHNKAHRRVLCAKSKANEKRLAKGVGEERD